MTRGSNSTSRWLAIDYDQCMFEYFKILIILLDMLLDNVNAAYKLILITKIATIYVGPKISWVIMNTLSGYCKIMPLMHNLYMKYFYTLNIQTMYASIKGIRSVFCLWRVSCKYDKNWSEANLDDFLLPYVNSFSPLMANW